MLQQILWAPLPRKLEPKRGLPISLVVQLANQQDVFADESPPPGFFKSLFPCWRAKGSTQSRMAWIKLVDNSGRTCGHAVLSARMVSAIVGEV
jgi:hypothetical protein